MYLIVNQLISWKSYSKFNYLLKTLFSIYVFQNQFFFYFIKIIIKTLKTFKHSEKNPIFVKIQIFVVHI